MSLEGMRQQVQEAIEDQATAAKLTLRAYACGNRQEAKKHAAREKAAYRRFLQLHLEIAERTRPGWRMFALDALTLSLGCAAVLFDLWMSKRSWLEGEWGWFGFWAGVATIMIWQLRGTIVGTLTTFHLHAESVRIRQRAREALRKVDAE